MDGRIESWNMPIMSWMNSIMWVPNHVASAVACMTGLMLFLNALQREKKNLLIATFFVGASFASALGLSVWVTFTFLVFWVVWMLVSAFRNLERRWVGWMMLPGVFAIILSPPSFSIYYEAAVVRRGLGCLLPFIFIHSFSAGS